MANIDEYLTRILTAVYGEDVRGSIHDAINAMNIESSSAKTAAITAQNSAQNSAEAASSSAASANSSAASALSSKNLAEGSKQDAAAAATAASTARIDAINAKTQASAYATAASQSESNARQYMNNTISVSESVDDKVADVVALKSDLINYHEIKRILYDSSGELLLDSDGEEIKGHIVYADKDEIISLQKILDSISTYLKNTNSKCVSRRLERIEGKQFIEKEKDIVTMTLAQYNALSVKTAEYYYITDV